MFFWHRFWTGSLISKVKQKKKYILQLDVYSQHLQESLNLILKNMISLFCMNANMLYCICDTDFDQVFIIFLFFLLAWM